MRGKFAGIFENRIRNLQATLKETSVQPQSERDNNRRRQWEQVAKRGQVGFLWAFCRLQGIYIYWRFHFNQQKNKTMYVIAESGDTGLLLYKNIGKGKSLSMEDFPFLMFRGILDKGEQGGEIYGKIEYFSKRCL